MLISEFIEYLNFSQSLKAIINQNADVIAVELLPAEGCPLKSDRIYLTTDIPRTERLLREQTAKNILCLCPHEFLKKVNTLEISPHTNIVFADPSDMTDLFLMRSKLTEQVLSDLNEDVKILEDLIVSGSMEQLVETGSRYLGCPFMILDSLQNIMCSAIDNEALESGVRNRIAELQPFSEQPGVERFNTIDRATYILCVEKEKPGESMLISQFTVDGKAFGYLIVDHGNNQLTLKDYYRTSVMSSLVCKLILSWDRVRNPINSFEALFLRILEGNMTSANALEECRKLNWLIPDRMRILVAEREDGQGAPSNLQPAFDDLLRLFSSAKGLLYTNKIVLFVDEKEKSDSLESALSEWRMRCGVSQLFGDLEEARKYFKQADSSLRLSSELHFESRICRFEDMNVYFMLDEIHDPEKLKQMISPGIYKLMETDRETGSELLETFEQYVDCVGNINIVSETLFVHRNTVKYRIGKIEEILQTDLKDPASYHVYMLSFKIIDYLRRRKLW